MGQPERSICVARLPDRLGAHVVPLEPDPWVEAFRIDPRGHGPVRGLLHAALRRVMTDFDVDGWLHTHPMALLGETSWRALCGGGGRLLDVGAGAGDVTECARSVFDAIVATELSRPMVRRLRRRGFEAHAVDLSRASGAVLGRFDVVSLLNVLDRCDRPVSLLRAAAACLRRDGRVLISVPLPVRPHVDRGASTVDPDEPLAGDGASFEAALVDLLERTVEPAGLRAVRLARAPYLSWGAAGRLHTLDAAIVVAQVAP